MGKVKIFGPKGDPGAILDPTRYTLVPWEEVKEGEPKRPPPTHQASGSLMEVQIPSNEWSFADRNAVLRKCSGPGRWNEQD